MNLEMLDGFFAALICCPDAVLPSESLPHIWGEDYTFENNDQAAEIIGPVMRHWNMIAAELFRTLGEDDVYLPVLLEDDDDTVRDNDWAHGFMRGDCREGRRSGRIVPSSCHRWMVRGLEPSTAHADSWRAPGSANRLGFAVQLCYLRFPGFFLGANEPPFPPLLKWVADQLNARRQRQIKALRFSKIVLEMLFSVAYSFNEFR